MEFNSEPVHNKKYLKAENIYIYIYITKKYIQKEASDVFYISNSD